MLQNLAARVGDEAPLLDTRWGDVVLAAPSATR